MRLFANKIHICWLFIFALSVQPPFVRAENSCDCPTPPGGQIKCEDNQVAICRVKDGKVYGQCKTPPSSAQKGIALRAWILTKLLQTTVRPEEIDRLPKYQKILSEGRYTNPRTGEVITFRVPRGR
jgi:hypothetical protein